ncbi:MAG: biopolymer transporter ExbD [Gammaproteobacteria bacterium]|jgi:biopolymer transport protein ExbD|nr:MAG: biopolymer transporter ExbD [Gammaproteobacteria bacterium]
MARKHHYRRRSKEQPNELDVTTFLNLMVVLVPFLLITAVFSRIAIVELNLPSSSSTNTGDQPDFRLEVIVRESGLEIGNGKSIIAALPKQDGEYDLQTLSRYVVSLKEDYPTQDSASVLLEPAIPYDYLIQVMDVVRSVRIPGAEEDGEDREEFSQLALFTQISVGEAP